VAGPKSEEDKVRQQKLLRQKVDEEIKRYSKIHHEVEKVVAHYRRLPAGR
jgi:competence protein ComGF